MELQPIARLGQPIRDRCGSDDGFLKEECDAAVGAFHPLADKPVIALERIAAAGAGHGD